MTIGKRIKQLRQNRGWSQGQLALKIQAHQRQISKYERDENVPSTEVLIRIAGVLNVSVDYLLFDDSGNTSPTDIADRELLQKLAEIDKLSGHDKKIVKGVLDTFIMKNRMQRLAAEAANAEEGEE